MTTARDLIRLSMKMAGILAVGQTTLAEDETDCFMLLNSMLASWTQSRWLVYHLLDIPCTSTGSNPYTVGPSGQFVCTRPDRIQAAYARLSPTSASPIDYPLSIINTHEEWSSVQQKSLKSFPNSIFYDPTLGSGTLYFWPVPSSSFELHIIVKETLTQFADLTTVISFPPEYLDTLLYNLSARIMLLYGLDPNPGITNLANASLNIIRVANNRVPLLRMPAGIGNRRGGWSGHGLGGFQDTAIIVDIGVLL